MVRYIDAFIENSLIQNILFLKSVIKKQQSQKNEDIRALEQETLRICQLYVKQDLAAFLISFGE